MKKIIIVMLFMVNIAYSQTNKAVDTQGFHITLTPQYYNKLKFDNKGELLIKSNNQFSGELVLSYHKNIVHNLGINMGAGLGLAPFNYSYDFKTLENSIFNIGIYADEYEYLDFNESFYSNYIWLFPVSLDYTFSIKKKLFNIELGTKLNLIVAYPSRISSESLYYIDENNQDVLLSKFYLDNFESKTRFSYFVKLGYFQKTGSKKLLIALEYSYTDKPLYKGNYHFENLPFESYGTVTYNINYIGVSIKY